MPPVEYRILAINPGSTSTKFGVFAGSQAVLVRNLQHSDGEMAPFRGRPVLDQEEFRREAVERELVTAGEDPSGFHAVAGRGGLLGPVRSGTYRVNQAMLDHLSEARRGEHASNLGAFLARAMAARAGVGAFIVDPVSVEEWPERARLSGLASIERQCFSHALNTKAVAKRYAREVGRSYEQLRLIVAHLGSGISISAHEDGRMIDVAAANSEAPFSAERAGKLPTTELVRLCFSGRYTHQQVEGLLQSGSGFYSYLGTKDLAEVERRIDNGDGRAALVFDAMTYQIAKEIGAMATVLLGRVDALLITGGMAHSARLVAAVQAAVGWIAQVVVYPGEHELQALAEGVLRVLCGEEPAREYGAT
ncbi:MAG: butyrate kinase [Terriglobia bacterium]